MSTVSVACLIYRILLIELSVLSQFQIPLKMRRRMIIAWIIRSGYNLIKAWKRLASAKTLPTTLITEYYIHRNGTSRLQNFFAQRFQN